MFDVSRILAIPELEPDKLQMGLSNTSWAVVAATGKTKDGSPAKASVLKQERKGVSQQDIKRAAEKVGIKGDKPMSMAIAEKTGTKSATLKPTTGNPETDRRYERLQNKKYKTAAEENALKMYESQMKADPSKFTEGDGVGFRVMVQGRSSQINRGFQIVSVDKKSKTALVKQVRDTGLTSTGGNYDRMKPMEVHVADLVRDGSKAKKSSGTPAIATPSKPETKPEKASNSVKPKTPAIANTVQTKEAVPVQQKTKASNSFELNLKRNLADNLKSYKNPKVQKKLSPQAFEGYAKQDVKEGIVAKTRRKITDNTTKLVSPLKEKGRLLMSSRGTIRRKKREISGRDYTANLERKGQLNLFNQPKQSAVAKIAPETAKKVKRAIGGKVNQASLKRNLYQAAVVDTIKDYKQKNKWDFPIPTTSTKKTSEGEYAVYTFPTNRDAKLAKDLIAKDYKGIEVKGNTITHPANTSMKNFKKIFTLAKRAK